VQELVGRMVGRVGACAVLVRKSHRDVLLA
jgi:hypothetical protein